MAEKILKLKKSKGRVNMSILGGSVPEDCDENLLSKLSSSKVGKYGEFTELLKIMQK